MFCREVSNLLEKAAPKKTGFGTFRKNHSDGINDIKESIQIAFESKLITLFPSNANDRNDWLQEISKVCADCAAKRIFGISLVDLLKKREQKQNEIPLFVKKIYDSFTDERLKIDGIFKSEGNKNDLQRIRNRLDSGEVIEFLKEDSIVVSNVLKSLLKELPEPAITYSLYDKLLEFVKYSNRDVSALREIVKLLPTPHYFFVVELLKFLSRVAVFSFKNTLDHHNLSLIMEPIILRKKVVVGTVETPYQHLGILEIMMDSFQELFPDVPISSDSSPSKTNHLSQSASLQVSNESNSSKSTSNPPSQENSRRDSFNEDLEKEEKKEEKKDETK